MLQLRMGDSSCQRSCQQVNAKVRIIYQAHYLALMKEMLERNNEARLELRLEEKDQVILQ